MKEYPLPPNAMPHTVRARSQGQRPGSPATRTARSAGSIPRPARRPSTRCPIPKAKDPHTLTFDKKGIACISRFQCANMIGRLNPETGDIKLVKVADAALAALRHQVRRRRHAVGLVQRAPCLLKVNPDTLELTESSCRCRHDRAPPRHRRRRHDLVREFGRRPHRPAQSEDRRDQGMGFALRPALASLRHRRGRRRRLVQRVRHAARSAGPLRHRDRNVPELGDPVRQHLCRHPAQCARDPARATC